MNLQNTQPRVCALILFLSVVLAVAGCSRSSAPEATATADAVYKNGRICTVNKQNHWTEAVAIMSGTFIKVGSSADIGKFIGTNTPVIDGQLDFPAAYTK
jgi:hypothetical protein